MIQHLDSCRKADLLLIADYFKMDVDHSEKKMVIKAKLTKGLLKQQILSVKVNSRETTLVKSESPKTVIQCKQLELEIKRLELREGELEVEGHLKVGGRGYAGW